MIVIHADSQSSANEVNKLVDSGADVFMLIYMDGCGPCNATRPEWAKLESALKTQYKHNNRLVIASVNSKVVDSVKYIGDINGFPTILYLSQNGKQMEQYESSSIKDKQRNVDCFMNWVESHVGKVVSESSHQNVLKRITKRHIQSKQKQSRIKRQSRRRQSRQKGRQSNRRYYRK
uniref:Thioredoxin domain-containing protein n=1 Tax=viral metagenome TaxID=1070528 RepID=A0A6C0I8Q7_9ZZZZ